MLPVNFVAEHGYDPGELNKYLPRHFSTLLLCEPSCVTIRSLVSLWVVDSNPTLKHHVTVRGKKFTRKSKLTYSELSFSMMPIKKFSWLLNAIGWESPLVIKGEGAGGPQG